MNETIVVTGGHAGIGGECTRRLLAAGARVVVASRDVDRARRELGAARGTRGGRARPGVARCCRTARTERVRRLNLLAYGHAATDGHRRDAGIADNHTEHLIDNQLAHDQGTRQPVGTLHTHRAHAAASNTCVQVGGPFAVVDVVFRRWCLTRIGAQC